MILFWSFGPVALYFSGLSKKYNQFINDMFARFKIPIFAGLILGTALLFYAVKRLTR